MKNVDDSCKTKYPVVLIHGTGFRDRKWLNYWGRIPKTLMSRGCEIYYGNQDSWATIEQNAVTVKKSIEEVLLASGAEKVNLIAHSKGGLDARYAISTLGMADRTVSLTTMACPHHGSKTMDFVCKLPAFLFRVVSVFINLWFRLLGDRNPDFHQVCRQFTTCFAEKFNRQNPDSEGVYYQSYAAVMKNSFSDFILMIPHFVISRIDGENDGLVTPASAEWSNFRGILRGSTRRGISHADEVDMRRRKLSKRTQVGHVQDICDVYMQIARDLKERGF